MAPRVTMVAMANMAIAATTEAKPLGRVHIRGLDATDWVSRVPVTAPRPERAGFPAPSPRIVPTGSQEGEQRTKTKIIRFQDEPDINLYLCGA